MAYAGWARKLKRNAIFGIRTRSTTRSDDAWEAAHVAAAPYSMSAAISILLGGLIAAFGQSENEMSLIFGAGLAIGLIQVAYAIKVANRSATDAFETA